MITSAKREGYILVWARVRSTRETLFIMRDDYEGVNVIKTSGVRYQPSVAVPIDFRAITP